MIKTIIFSFLAIFLISTVAHAGNQPITCDKVNNLINAKRIFYKTFDQTTHEQKQSGHLTFTSLKSEFPRAVQQEMGIKMEIDNDGTTNARVTLDQTNENGCDFTLYLHEFVWSYHIVPVTRNNQIVALNLSGYRLLLDDTSSPRNLVLYLK